MDAEGNALVEEEQHGGREREGLQESVEVSERGEERGRSAGGAEQRAEEVGGVEVQVLLLEAVVERRGKRDSLIDGWRRSVRKWMSTPRRSAGSSAGFGRERSRWRRLLKERTKPR